MRFLALLLFAAAAGAPAQLALAVTQPCGAGSIRIAVTGAGPAAELFNLVQLTPAAPTGSGPIFGLGVAGSDVLLPQITAPPGAAPFHVAANAGGAYTWTVCGTPIGLTVPIDVVTVEWGPSGYVAHTPVAHISLSM